MNKQEKLIATLLALVLVGWIWHSVSEQKKAAAAQAQVAAESSVNVPPAPAVVNTPQQPAVVASAESVKEPEKVQPTVPRGPEKRVTLKNDEVELTFSSYGATLQSAKMLKYAQKPGKLSEENPALVLDFASSPALALDGLSGANILADFVVVKQDDSSITFTNALMKREIVLKPGYQISVSETFTKADATAKHSLSLGSISMGSSKNDLLSIDSWVNEGKEPHVVHHSEEEPLKGYLVGGMAGGCGGKRSAAGIPLVMDVDVPGGRPWLAVKNRFFVAALVQCSEANTGFKAQIIRDETCADYQLKSVAARAMFAGVSPSRQYTFYVGPKKQALLWDLGMKDVMEFGMWRWLCYPLVWVLNLFNSWIPNYGVAIILLTVLVRLIFWPLTHKSTIGMRKMQEIQPKVKEIQKKFKDNPQRLQQETWQIYRENKVNPMSSCLPMLVQIPVFIALFTVLRSAVELRFAPFLWISDLSEPEALFASWFPFGGLNILPLLMAGLTMLQSAFTPSSGDNKQQQMMMIMMPLIMLFMFYNFPSALSLYWALSTAFSVAQAWWIKRKYGTPTVKKGDAVEPDNVEMPQTRQMRRHAK